MIKISGHYIYNNIYRQAGEYSMTVWQHDVAPQSKLGSDAAVFLLDIYLHTWKSLLKRNQILKS